MNKQTPPAGATYDEATHQWLPAAPVPRPGKRPAPVTPPDPDPDPAPVAP